MERKCHDLTLTFRESGASVCRELDFGIETIREIENKIKAETLLTFGAVYGDDEWAIDVSCEGNFSYIVIIEIETGTTYTFLNSQYSDLLEHYNSLPNIFICSNMDDFEQDEKNSTALTTFEINGTDCPLLHICKDKDRLFEIITDFINSDSLFAGAMWLRNGE